jgi:competence protein ComFC
MVFFSVAGGTTNRPHPPRPPRCHAPPEAVSLNLGKLYPVLLRRLSRSLSEFLYPSTCCSCDARFEGANVFCPACHFELLELESAGRCPGCAMPLVTDLAPCPYCQGKGLRPYSAVARLAIFTDPLRPAVHHMKYHRRWSLAESLADRLFTRPDVKDLLTRADVLVPMPLYWRKQISRGYNQSDVLARRLGKLSDTPVRRPVRRIKDTPSQTGLHSQSDRWLNVRDAFRLTRPSQVEGKHVVVIDDVMTTGATLRAVGRQLAKAKPASLSAIVLAIADPKGRGFEAI